MSIYIGIYFSLFVFSLLERIDDLGEVSGKLTRKSFYALVCFSNLFLPKNGLTDFCLSRIFRLTKYGFCRILQS